MVLITPLQFRFTTEALKSESSEIDRNERESIRQAHRIDLNGAQQKRGGREGIISFPVSGPNRIAYFI